MQQSLLLSKTSAQFRACQDILEPLLHTGYEWDWSLLRMKTTKKKARKTVATGQTPCRNLLFLPDKSIKQKFLSFRPLAWPSLYYFIMTVIVYLWGPGPHDKGRTKAGPETWVTNILTKMSPFPTFSLTLSDLFLITKLFSFSWRVQIGAIWQVQHHNKRNEHT